MSSLAASERQQEQKQEQQPASVKAVSIAEPESACSNSKGKSREGDDAAETERGASRQFPTSVSKKKLSGRPPIERGNPSSKQSQESSQLSEAIKHELSQVSGRRHRHYSNEGLVAQVSAWIKQEKARRAARKAKAKVPSQASILSEAAIADGHAETSGGLLHQDSRRSSQGSEGSVALDTLEAIIEKGLSTVPLERTHSRKQHHLPHRPKLRPMSTNASSDTEYLDGDAIVPSCDAVLDNSKTLAYTGGSAESEQGAETPGKITAKEKEAWATFKFEIVRLAHTLRLKGWRRVPMEMSNEIGVERLSGALTNAVYVVSPPVNLPPRRRPQGADENEVPVAHKAHPPKLLLRIYGPQVEHLIDREAELQVLRRLARKRIGPRLLGTFTNGRFEEFYHARPLTAKDLRVPETSKQIAKRMRELHEGIDLLPQEREEGPFVWRNWDKWVERCEQIAEWLDDQIINHAHGAAKAPAAESWRHRGLVCGVEWSFFRQTVDKYRAWLIEQYGGEDKINERLVFAHNDTQYGNILRLIPAGESPLLLPANEHKQLVVIDFEYANANLPGLEFANHFTEWCYNYHDPVSPHSIVHTLYPTLEEQRRFIRSYVRHQPWQSSRSSGPSGQIPSSSISTFMLDSRAPPGSSYHEQEEAAEKETEEKVQRLIAETRLWRLANSAQWVLWGIVQAKVPGLPDEIAGSASTLNLSAIDGKEKVDDEEGSGDVAELLQARAKEIVAEGKDGELVEEEEFDYLAYAQDRALFFWGDAVSLGIVKEEELPAWLRQRIKVVAY